MTRKSLMILLGVLFLPATSPAYDLYVRSVNAPVYAMPDTASGVVTTVGQGTKLAGIENKGNWHMVKAGDHTGWVYRFLVGDKPLADTGDGSLAGQYAEQESKARRRPSSYTAAAAARGLREKRQRFAEKYHLDYEALARIEAMAVSREEVTSFIKEGIENEKKD
ncbi:MAG: hypothetical protein AB1724_02960 [Thermodesulfobacteriota bacterium]